MIRTLQDIKQQQRRKRAHRKIVFAWICTNVLPLLALQIYGMFWSGVPRARSTFDIVSLATSLYMDVLPLLFACKWGLSEWDFVRLHWPAWRASLKFKRQEDGKVHAMRVLLLLLLVCTPELVTMAGALIVACVVSESCFAGGHELQQVARRSV